MNSQSPYQLIEFSGTTLTECAEILANRIAFALTEDSAFYDLPTKEIYCLRDQSGNSRWLADISFNTMLDSSGKKRGNIRIILSDEWESLKKNAHNVPTPSTRTKRSQRGGTGHPRVTSQLSGCSEMP